MKVLTFSIDNTHYALSIVSILQVIRERCVVDMPYDTTWFTGIIQYENMMIPVLNLKQPLKDCSDESSDEHLRRTIVLEVNGHAVGAARMACPLVKFGTLQQGLGWNTAGIQAGATQ